MTKKTKQIDKAVADLLATIERKKESCKATAAALKNRRWLTNLTFRRDPDSAQGIVNIATIRHRESLLPILTFLLGFQERNTQARELLGMKGTPEHLGYPIADWISDIRLKNDKLQAQAEEKKLTDLEKRAAALLGEEQKRELELTELMKEFDD